MAEKRIVCFQSKNSENMQFLTVILIYELLYVFEEICLNMCITNDVLVYSGGQLLQRLHKLLCDCSSLYNIFPSMRATKMGASSGVSNITLALVFR